MKAILFDLDDTLYDEATFVVSGFEIVAQHIACECAMKQTEILQTMLGLLASNGRGRIFDDILQMCGLYSNEFVQDLVTIYRSHVPQIELWPEVRPALNLLKQSGMRLGIVTDGLFAVQESKIRALDLEGRLDAITYTDELGKKFWKPHIAGFELALTRLDTEPEKAMYVGNDPLKDFHGPLTIGMSTVQVVRLGKEYYGRSEEAEHHIHDLDELLDYLKERRWI